MFFYLVEKVSEVDVLTMLQHAGDCIGMIGLTYKCVYIRRNAHVVSTKPPTKNENISCTPYLYRRIR